MSSDDILEAADELKARIIIGADFDSDKPPMGSDWQNCNSQRRETSKLGDYAPTSWHLWWHENEWTVVSFHSEPLNVSVPELEHRQCARMELCHKTGYELAMMFMKNVRGRATGDDALYLSLPQRQQVLDTAFNFCLLYTSPSPRDGLLSRMPSSA